MDINNLGEFTSMEAVEAAYPYGGTEGDYLTINGVKYNWNKYTLKWGNETESSSRQKAEFSDLQVQNDVLVGGNQRVRGDLQVDGLLRANHVQTPNKGLFDSLAALQQAYPFPLVGMWAAVGDSFPADVYRCDVAGAWSATGETIEEVQLTNILLYSPQTLTDAEKKQARDNIGITEEMALAGVWDVTAHNDNATFTDLQALLNHQDINTLIPVEVRKGGMSIKFVLTSDNKYVQYRYMGTATTGSPDPFLDTANWQGVDDEPTAGSDNLVKSGGVDGFLQNKVIVGNNDTLVLSYTYGLIVEHRYNIIVKNPSWDISGVTLPDSYNILIIEAFDNTDTKIGNNLYNCKKQNYPCLQEIEFDIPDDTSYIRFSIRATEGEKVYYTISDLK